jgi:ABC-2 type transport system permease protein
MNLEAVRAIYLFEMARTGRTLLQSIVSPVISTSLYFVVFGAAIGSRITELDGGPSGAFFETADVSVSLSLVMTLLFLGICLAVTAWIFKTGYRLKN